MEESVEDPKTEEKPVEEKSTEEKSSEEKPSEENATEEKQDGKPEESKPEELVEPVWQEFNIEEIDAETPHENQLTDYQYLTACNISEMVLGPQRPESRKDCEVFMLIGLPGAGKSHWACKRREEFPEKRYTILGTKFLLEKMRIMGESRRVAKNSRWEKMIEQLNRGLQILFDIACKRRRNYILDQPHVYISNQRRKMRVFGDFKRIAVVVVPEEEEFERRFKERLEKEGKDFPDATISELKANISLPELEYKWFDEILYTDLDSEKAKEMILKENEKGKKEEAHRRRRNEQRGRDNRGRNDFRGGRDSRDFRRDRWGPPCPPRGMGYMQPPPFRRDYPQGHGYDRDRRGNWGGNDSWVTNNRQRGGYGGAPPPRPGGRRDDMNRGNNRRDNRRDFDRNSNRNDKDRRDDRNRGSSGKNNSSNKKDWNSNGNQGPWGGTNNTNSWNNYGNSG